MCVCLFWSHFKCVFYLLMVNIFLRKSGLNPYVFQSLGFTYDWNLDGEIQKPHWIFFYNEISVQREFSVTVCHLFNVSPMGGNYPTSKTIQQWEKKIKVFVILWWIVFKDDFLVKLIVFLLISLTFLFNWWNRLETNAVKSPNVTVCAFSTMDSAPNAPWL